MDMNKIAWSIKGKWYTVKQTCVQFKNFVTGQELTPKGHDAYEYYCKVIFDGYEPVSMAELMFEDTLKEKIEKLGMDRKSAAIVTAGHLAKHIKPWDFWKKEHKIIGG